MSSASRLSPRAIHLAAKTAALYSRRTAGRSGLNLVYTRFYSSTGGYGSSSGAGFHPSINSTMAQLDSLSIPKFEMPTDSVQVLTRPAEFYNFLKDRISKAEKRIFLATLYIGKTEHELIDCLRQALQKNSELEVSILSDALRGTREAPWSACSASLLAPLVEEFGSKRVHIQMYHSPGLHGLRAKLIPKRFNEGWGLQHMKLYGFDDEIVLSGANLSQDYFTNRQDRYVVLKSKPVTDYYYKIHKAVSSLSYTVAPVPKLTTPNRQSTIDKFLKTVKQTFVAKKSDPTFELQWTRGPYFPNPVSNPDQFVQEATKVLAPLLKYRPEPVEVSDETQQECLTYVYPISQFSPLLKPVDSSTEFPVISRILSMLTTFPTDFTWTFTAGYFNIHPAYKQTLLRSSPPASQGGGTVICASPLANGFYKSKGVSGMLPDAYSLLASRFLADVELTKNERSASSEIKVLEWQRGTVNTKDGWSFHSKGIWLTPASESPEGPAITIVGSSNYTRRAYKHDLESNALIITKDPALRGQLQNEIDSLLEYTGLGKPQPMQKKDYEERKPSPLLKALTWLLGDRL